MTITVYGQAVVGSVTGVKADNIVMALYVLPFLYTIRQNNPRTTVRTLPNVKMPSKAHKNNVTFKAKSANYTRCIASSDMSLEYVQLRI